MRLGLVIGVLFLILAAPSSSAGTTAVGAPLPSARVGAYYFGGSAAPLDSFHFNGLLSGPFSSWQPLSGWRSTERGLDAELRYAHGAGIDFFIFDYYWAPSRPTISG